MSGRCVCATAGSTVFGRRHGCCGYWQPMMRSTSSSETPRWLDVLIYFRSVRWPLSDWLRHCCIYNYPRCIAITSGLTLCILMTSASLSHINEQNLTVCNIVKGRRQQSRRTKEANITKDDIISQYIAEMSLCCEVISSFVIFAVLVLRLCCLRPYKVL